MHTCRLATLRVVDLRRQCQAPGSPEGEPDVEAWALSGYILTGSLPPGEGQGWKARAGPLNRA